MLPNSSLPSTSTLDPTSDSREATEPFLMIPKPNQKFLDEIRRYEEAYKPFPGGPLMERLEQAVRQLPRLTLRHHREYGAFKSIVNDQRRLKAAVPAADANTLKAQLHAVNGFISTYRRGSLVSLMTDLRAELVESEALRMGPSGIDSTGAKRLPEDYLTYRYRCRAARDNADRLPPDTALWEHSQQNARIAQNSDKGVRKDFAEGDSTLRERVQIQRDKLDACKDRISRECVRVLEEPAAFAVLADIDLFLGDRARTSKAEEGIDVLQRGAMMIRELNSEHSESFDHYSTAERRQLTSLVTAAVDMLAAQMEADAPRSDYPPLIPVATRATPSASADSTQ